MPSYDYTLHLGYNWNGPIIGTLFGEPSTPQRRFLQFALEDARGNPAYFRFAKGATFGIQVHCLDTPGIMPTDLYLAFGPVTLAPGETLTSTLAPNSVVQAVDCSAPSSTLNGQTVLKFLSGSTYVSQGTSPWGPTQATLVYDGGLQFESVDQTVEMGFLLQAEDSARNMRDFIGDPEAIVGEGGSPG